MARRPGDYYPSDERRRKNKPAVRVHQSVETHPRMAAVYSDNDLFATWTRVMVAASRAHAGRTGDRLTFSRHAAATLAGRSSVARALPLLRELCAAVSWVILESDSSVTIHVRNFARKQGFDPADRGVVVGYDPVTPDASESESESESKEEEEEEDIKSPVPAVNAGRQNGTGDPIFLDPQPGNAGDKDPDPELLAGQRRLEHKRSQMDEHDLPRERGATRQIGGAVRDLHDRTVAGARVLPEKTDPEWLVAIFKQDFGGLLCEPAKASYLERDLSRATSEHSDPAFWIRFFDALRGCADLRGVPLGAMIRDEATIQTVLNHAKPKVERADPLPGRGNGPTDPFGGKTYVSPSGRTFQVGARQFIVWNESPPSGWIEGFQDGSGRIHLRPGGMWGKRDG